ncbi:MAG: hypothetical protein AAGU11_19395 [Syntrophobacteraceae bacterium]
MNSGRCENLDSDLIVPDSPEAMRLGYCSAKFEGYIRHVNRTIYIWQIHSKDPGKGHLSALVQKMLDSGYTVKIPTPIGRMAEIVKQKGFVRTIEYDPELEPYGVWIKEPSSAAETRS